MDLKELCRHLFHETYPRGVSNDYIDFDSAVRSSLSSLSGVKTDLVAGSLLPADRLTVSVIFSDFTSLYLTGGKEGYELGIPIPYQDVKEQLRDVLKAFQLEDLEEYPKIELEYCFGFPSDQLIEELEPLANSGRIMFRPMPKLAVETQDGRRKYLQLDPNSPQDLWLPQSSGSWQQAIPLKSGPTVLTDEQMLISLTLPYIRNISFSDLAKILDDEALVLSDLRMGIKTLLDDASKKSQQSQEILEDVVRPAVDRVERRFRSIAQIHGLKIAGATVSTCALGLLALTGAGVASSIAKIIGPAGIGLVAKEVSDYVKSKAELKELPFYLLWRLSKGHRAK